MTHITIGIDPDIDKCGVALYSKQGGITLNMLHLWEVFDVIRAIHADGNLRYVCIEAGHKEKKSNWHAAKNTNIAQAIGRSVGLNNAIGRVLEDFCVALGIEHRLAPVAGYSKVDAKMFKATTGYQGRTNPETRAAGMIAFVYGTRGSNG
jgi:hypothetical protein